MFSRRLRGLILTQIPRAASICRSSRAHFIAGRDTPLMPIAMVEGKRTIYHRAPGTRATAHGTPPMKHFGILTASRTFLHKASER